MTSITIAEPTNDPNGLLRRVAAGETLRVLDGNTPVAEIRPADDAPRPSGLCKGEFVVPDDFDAPLPAEILGEFNPQ